MKECDKASELREKSFLASSYAIQIDNFQMDVKTDEETERMLMFFFYSCDHVGNNFFFQLYRPFFKIMLLH